ncbi:NAD-dependent epimerase/dehydratase family protein [Gymnodinialimonas sp.]
MTETLAGKPVLVTGASGFLGGHLCRALANLGADVTGLGRRPCKPETYEYLALPFDAREFEEFLASRRFDYVFHLAGWPYATQSVTQPGLDFESNYLATAQLFRALQRSGFAGALVYVSSGAVYGEMGPTPFSEHDVPRPMSPYAQSKLRAEQLLRSPPRPFRFRSAVARLFSVYGPGQTKQVIYDVMCKASQAGETIDLLGSGKEVRDFLYVDDAIRGLLTLANHASEDTPVFNICSGHGVAIEVVAARVLNAMGSSHVSAVFRGQNREGEAASLIGDCNRLKTVGFLPETSFGEGLQKTAEWFSECCQTNLNQSQLRQ